MQPPARGVARVFVHALSFALLAAVLELGIVGYRRLVAHAVIDEGWKVLWMAPLANVTLFALAAIPLALLASLRPNRVSWTISWAFGALLMYLSILLLFPRINPIASLALAAGLAWRTATVLSARSAGADRVARRGALLLSFTFAVVGIGATVAHARAEQRALARVPSARAGAPSVLLLILDTVRAASMSLYGYSRPTTPNIDRWAARGVVFDRAVAPAPWTLPSHASMFTGRWPHELSVGWKSPLDATYPTLAEALAAHGYFTGGFVANLAYTTAERGLDRGFAHYDDYPTAMGQVMLSSALGREIGNNGTLRRLLNNHELLNRKRAEDVIEAFQDWRDDHPGRPIFAFLNFFDAHVPYLPPPPFDRQFGSGRAWRTYFDAPNFAMWTDTKNPDPAMLRAERDAYDGAIAYQDARLGILLDALEKAHSLDSTIVIIAADHGEEFNEHGVVNHANSLYNPALWVPLIIIAPGRVPAGVRVTEPVSLRDVAASVVDLAQIPAISPFPGRSLARFWRGDGVTAETDTLLSELTRAPATPAWAPAAQGKGMMVSVVSGTYHLIRRADAEEELYDVQADRMEATELLRSPSGTERAIALRGLFPPLPLNATSRPTVRVPPRATP